MEQDLDKLLNLALKAAEDAGNEILKVYETGNFGVEAKADNSPLTLADKKAHAAIMAMLKPTQIPVLSEEGADISYQERRGWDSFWMVDPLDGTKEFIKQNGEFTVNIALISNNRPILGVVYVPVKGWMYYTSPKKGAFKREGVQTPVSISVAATPNTPLTIVASRSHLNEATKEFVAEHPGATLVSMGSSLKLLLVAEGKADLYPRFAPTMEWDTAAAQAIVEAAGGKVLEHPSGKPMRYNKENLLNPWFLVSA